MINQPPANPERFSLHILSDPEPVLLDMEEEALAGAPANVAAVLMARAAENPETAGLLARLRPVWTAQAAT